ncbi:hypothetical protein C2E23DRAFT_410623 [Lenzites betulinus]|nr:hypothetical protein C2E23DRAFT_410623 [Lenzites betulinus]
MTSLRAQPAFRDQLHGSPQCWSYSPPYPLFRPKLLPVRRSQGGASQGKLEAQVCLLDPGAAHRGAGGRQGPLGCADGEPGAGHLGGVTVDQGGLVGLDMQYIEGGPLYGAPLYDRCDDAALGAEEETEEAPVWEDVRRCFNCGSEDHAVSGCRERLNRALISLTRQLFDFHRGKSSGPAERLHEAERSRLQRLCWLDEFDPGQIKGPLLREALGLQDSDPGGRVEWLYNMAHWGYPPGWIGEHDPREYVWRCIAWGTVESDEECELTIFADDSEEHLTLPRSDVTSSLRKVEGTLDSEASSDQSTPALRRWATYPNTYANCSTLPVFQGETPPEVVAYGQQAAAAYSAYMSYWQAAYAQPPPDEPTAPPPPPPSSTPPPLPAEHAPAPVSISAPAPSPLREEANQGSDEEDMDFSD